MHSWRSSSTQWCGVGPVGSVSLGFPYFFLPWPKYYRQDSEKEKFKKRLNGNIDALLPAL
jgi:hypothetical protein